MGKSPAKPTEAQSEAPRTIKPITDIRRNDEGAMAITTWVARMPPDTILQDLQNHGPELWRNVLGNMNTPIRKLDTVIAIAHDESWMVHATVGAVDHQSVTLCGIKKADLPAPQGNLFSDENYSVKWDGSGYSIFRNNDGTRMDASSYGRPEQAKMALLSLYGRRAA